MEAAKLRGQGIAEFRKEVSDGIKLSVESVQKSGEETVITLMFSMWMDTMKSIAEANKSGNVMFFDGSQNGFNDTLKRIQASSLSSNNEKVFLSPSKKS